MSPTVFRHKNYRAFFFSREEPRLHVHIACPEGEAKFWMEPILALAGHSGLPRKTLMEMQAVIEERNGEIQAAWKKHFGARR